MKNIILSLVLLSLMSCVAAELSYPEKDFNIKLPINLQVQIMAGESYILAKKDSFKIVKIKFFRVRGGKTYFLGKEIRDAGNGYSRKRLFLLENGVSKYAFSVNDILKMNTERIDTFDVYILPVWNIK